MRRTRAILISLTIAALIAAGCSSSSDEGSEQSSGTAAASATATTGTPPATIAASVTTTATASAVPSRTATATTTPTPTATPYVDEAGEAGFRSFARFLEAGLRAQGAAAVKARWKTTTVNCTAADVPVRLSDEAPCAAAGVTYEAVLVSRWRSGGGPNPVENANRILDRASAGQQPGRSDRFGDGGLRVHALVVNPTARVGAFRTVTSAIVTSAAGGSAEPSREAWVIDWTFVDGRWRATGLMEATTLVEELLQPAPGGGTHPLNGWEPYR